MTDIAKVLEEINKELVARQAKGIPKAPLVIACELVRKKLRLFSESRKRNAILYYSSWPMSNKADVFLSTADLDPLTTMVRDLNPKLGVDIIIRTPGGEATAVESLIRSYRKYFDDDIEVFVPFAAMSAGTMIACASKCIHMASHASLGPVDLIVKGYSAIGLLADHEIAQKEMQEDPSKVAIWKIHFERFPLVSIKDYKSQINWSRELLTEYLTEVMFADGKRGEKIPEIVSSLTEMKNTITHSRHIGIDEAKRIGLAVEPIDEDTELGKLLRSIHDFCCFITDTTYCHKFFCNSSGMIAALGERKL